MIPHLPICSSEKREQKTQTIAKVAQKQKLEKSQCAQCPFGFKTLVFFFFLFFFVRKIAPTNTVLSGGDRLKTVQNPHIFINLLSFALHFAFFSLFFPFLKKHNHSIDSFFFSPSQIWKNNSIYINLLLADTFSSLFFLLFLLLSTCSYYPS